MNYNTKNIIQTYTIITGNENKEDIQKKLMKSKVFREVKKGDPTYLHEGYTANILEIVSELKAQPDYPEEICKITPDTVVIANRARRSKRKALFRFDFPVRKTDAIRAKI